MTGQASNILDDAEARARLDPSGMVGAIHALPEQCREAWEAAEAFPWPRQRTPERIVLLSMGGSAIAGDYFRALLALESNVPVFNVRQYVLPPFVDERTLLIAASFSGDTEEVLAAFEQALATPATKLVITTGGQLLATARANGVPAFTFAYAGEPRAATGWGLMPLLSCARSLGLMQAVERDIDETVEVLAALRKECAADVSSLRNPAKQLAVRLHQRLPVIYGAGPLIEVARRWKCQLNESAKTLAFYEEMPESQHNAIVALAQPQAVSAANAALFLQSETLDHPRLRLRYDFARRLFERAAVPCDAVQSRGKSALAQMLYLTLLGDYTAAYLALLYDVDPTPTTVIDELKAWLAALSDQLTH